eukprot:GFYU01001001.1.p1 GENE.GFYU01001001.1~~GFYU01001001.1.p1  ORF type:complete len:410 (+),score=100.27 GFYU01001001.1:106-1335(+)
MSTSKRGPSGTIRFRTSLKNTIYDVLKARNWKETDSDTDWDFNWADTGWMRECFDQIHLEEWQRVNHFRNHYELTRKDLLIKNLKRTKKQLEREDRSAEAAKYDFYPSSFVLPVEYGMFVEEFKKIGGVWIMKPIGKAQGKGIFLFNKLSQISDWKKDHRWKSDSNTPQAETYIVQRYIENPYLIGGKKFDLRIYVMVTSYSPLTVYLYRSGFARFSNYRFSMNSKEIQNNYIHLTNVAVQKTAPEYDTRNGCKWNIRSLKLYMMSKHGQDAVNDLYYEIQQLVIRSLMGVQKVMINDKHCFELYGFDIIIDTNLKPWLLEVNASPSLTADTQEDYELKTGILDDMLYVVDMEHRLSGNEEQIGGFDLIYMNGPIKNNDRPSGYRTYLGCDNNRQKNLQKLLKTQKKKN